MTRRTTTSSAVGRRNGADREKDVAQTGRLRRLTAGLGLVGMTAAVGLAGAIAPSAAAADPADEVADDPADAPVDDPADDAAQESVEVTDSALYVAPMTDAIPATLTESIPPAAVCVVQPELCPEQLDPVRNPLRDAVRTALGEAQDLPVQPVPEDSAAVSLFGGHARYQTAIKFDTPSVPDGEELLSFEVRIPQSQPSYDLNSPLFRGVVLSAFEFIGSGRDPAVLADELASALEETPIEVGGDVIGIEACPLLQAFEPAGAPMAADHREIPSREEDDQPVADVDCILGSGGEFDEDAEEWVFDLAFTVNAWNEGEIENHGLLLRPTGAPNLAFGDPDTSTMAQVVLDLTDVRASASSVEAFDPEDLPPLDDLPSLEDEDLDLDEGFEDEEFGDVDGFDDADGVDDFGFDDAPADSGGGDLGMGDVPGIEDPATAEEAELPEAEAPSGPEVADQALAIDRANTPGPPVGGPGWWVWLLAPVFLGGAYLTSTTLMSPAAGAAGGTQQGALSRLLASRPRA